MGREKRKSFHFTTHSQIGLDHYFFVLDVTVSLAELVYLLILLSFQLRLIARNTTAVEAKFGTVAAASLASSQRRILST